MFVILYWHSFAYIKAGLLRHFNWLKKFRLVFPRSNTGDFVILRIVTRDTDKGWALHMKDHYFGESVRLCFIYKSQSGQDSISRMLVSETTPFVLVPLRNEAGYQVHLYRQIFKGTRIRKDFIKGIKRFLKD